MEAQGITVYNLPSAPPNWDSLGIFYIVFASIWTTLVVVGMLFCLHNRRVPLLRVRNLPLSFAAITFLHLYWILAQLVYPIGQTLPVLAAYDVQYFVMGICFPLGIALFHASNWRFLRVAQLQRRFLEPEYIRRSRRHSHHDGYSLLGRWRNLLLETKVMTIIGLGMVFQTILCIAMWAVCEKYHPGFGIPGTQITGSTIPEQLIDLGRGWEWWPSFFWQVLWMWVFAPFLIWRAWDIHDSLGWRTQTIGSCLSGLHAAPMFLIALYVPAFTKVNIYFGASQWIHLNTFFIEIFTIFVPARQVIKMWSLGKKVTDGTDHQNKDWDSTSVGVLAPKQSRDTYSDSSEKFSSFDDSVNSFNQFDGIFNNHLLTMSALERFLDDHPMLLQTFSACRDFSGENIMFLLRVARWKASCPDVLEGPQRTNFYNSALGIYLDIISPQDADFPLNLFSQQLQDLQDIFEQSARASRCGPRVDTILPFDEHSSQGLQRSRSALDAGFHIPESFGKTVFDSAQSSIKWLVLTNTWPRFVMEMQSRSSSPKNVDSRSV